MQRKKHGRTQCEIKRTRKKELIFWWIVISMTEDKSGWGPKVFIIAIMVAFSNILDFTM